MQQTYKKIYTVDSFAYQKRWNILVHYLKIIKRPWELLKSITKKKFKHSSIIDEPRYKTCSKIYIARGTNMVHK